MSEGEGHHRQRRFMQPAFHRAEIDRYVAMMRDVAVPRISAWPDGGALALDREMRSITLTVLTRTLLSSNIGPDAIDEIERLHCPAGRSSMSSSAVTCSGRKQDLLQPAASRRYRSGPDREIDHS